MNYLLVVQVFVRTPNGSVLIENQQLGIELGELKTFARDLMGDMERDLGTKLDWIGVD
ncbi:hypothetical protein FS819_022450 [Allorhizobium sp. Av2]